MEQLNPSNSAYLQDDDDEYEEEVDDAAVTVLNLPTQKASAAQEEEEAAASEEQEIDQVLTRIQQSAKTTNSKKLTQYTLQMLNFIPTSILLHLSQEPLSSLGKLPLVNKTKSCVMVCELRNFYDIDPLCQSFATEQMRNEYLQTVAAQFLEVVTSALSKYGGDLIQFFGRSCISIFPQTNQDTKDICARAVSCAIETARECEKFLPKQNESGSSGFKAKMDIKFQVGIGYGEVQVLHVGGTLNRVEFFVAGEALMQALNALRLSESGIKQVCVSQQIWELVEDNFEGRQTNKLDQNLTFLSPLRPKIWLEEPKPEDLCFWFINKSKMNMRPSRDMFLLKLKQSEDVVNSIQLQLKYYIPGAYRHLSLIKQNQSCFSQHSKHTVIACAIEINTHQRVKRQINNHRLVQNIVTVVQAQVYKMFGSITKIQSYESGIIVIATWGMQFMNHTDDCSRAVFAAINIKKNLTALQLSIEQEDAEVTDPPVYVGIATGDIFSSVIGSQQRKEIVGIGEVQERALALLQTAYDPEKSNVFLDFQTKQLACHEIEFVFVKHLELPQKVLNIGVYSPLVGIFDRETGSIQDSRAQLNQVKDLFSFSTAQGSVLARKQSIQIRLNSNPFFIDRENYYNRNYCQAHGREKIAQTCIRDISEYFCDDSFLFEPPWILAIKGKIGSGKSLFARNILLSVSEVEKDILGPVIKNMPYLRLEYLCINNDANKASQFLGAWRRFIQHLLGLLAVEQNCSKEQIVQVQLQHTAAIQNKLIVVQEIFGIEHVNKKQHSLKQHEMSTSFKQESYDPEFEEIVIKFCLEFIKQGLDQLRNKVCFFIIMDNADLMNYSSWRFFEMLHQKLQGIVLLMCFKSVTNYFKETAEDEISQLGFQISDEQAAKFYKDFIKPKESLIFAVAEMTPWSTNSFRTALKELSPVYERTMSREIEDMTDIIDGKTSKKNFNEQKEIKMALLSKYQVYAIFNDIEDDILEKVIVQAEGNPQVCFDIIFQNILLNTITVDVDKKLLRATEKFKDLQQNDVPFSVFKQMNVFLEQSLKKVNRRCKRLSNLMTIQLISLLSSAAVIGYYFSQNLLENCENTEQIIPKNEITTNLSEILKDAENRDLVELVMLDEFSGDIVYRFTNPFLRMSLYQMQSFSTLRKESHQSIIKYSMQRSLLDFTNAFSNEQEISNFVWHLCKFERVNRIEDLSPNSRQQLQIKKIIINFQSKQKLKSGKLLVQFPQEKGEIFLVQLMQQRVEFLKENSYNTKKVYAYAEYKQIRKLKEPKQKEAKEEQTGLAKLEGLATGLLEEQEQDFQPLFKIHLSKWFKSDRLNDRFQVQKTDTISVAAIANNKKALLEVEDWRTAIEFIRTKYQYDNFTQKYGEVSLNYMPEQQKQQIATEYRCFQLKQALLERQPLLRTDLVLITKKQSEDLSPSKKKKNTSQTNDLSRLVQKIKSLYTVSKVQFLDHLQAPFLPAGYENLQEKEAVAQPGESRILGETNPNLRNIFSTLLKNYLPQQLSSADFSLSRSSSSHQLQISDHSNSIKSLNAKESVQMQPSVNETTHFYESVPAVLVFEDNKIKDLQKINDLWKEGNLVVGGIQTYTNSHEDEEFKVLKRHDPNGYNICPKQFRTPFVSIPQTLNNTVEGLNQQKELETCQSINTFSIVEKQFEEKLPKKQKRQKAEAIQKLLENGNTPFYNKYIQQVQHRPQDPSQISEEDSYLSELESNARSLKPGGLTASASHQSISQSQKQLGEIDSKKHFTFQAMPRREIHQTSTQKLLQQLSSKAPKEQLDSLAEKQFDSSSQASFQDYTPVASPTPDKLPDQFISFQKGCPVTVSSMNPQYIGPRDLPIQKGSIVYLNEELTQQMHVQCNFFNGPAKFNIVINRDDLQLDESEKEESIQQETSNHSVVSSSSMHPASQSKRQIPIIAQGLHTIQTQAQKIVESKDSLLSHVENSQNSFSIEHLPLKAPQQKNQIVESQGQKMALVSAGGLKHQNPVHHHRQSSGFEEDGVLKKLQQRKINREKLQNQSKDVKADDFTQINSPPKSTIEQVSQITEPVEQMKANKPTLKAIERLQKRKQQQALQQNN